MNETIQENIIEQKEQNEVLLATQSDTDNQQGIIVNFTMEKDEKLFSQLSCIENNEMNLLQAQSPITIPSFMIDDDDDIYPTEGLNKSIDENEQSENQKS